MSSACSSDGRPGLQDGWGGATSLDCKDAESRDVSWGFLMTVSHTPHLAQGKAPRGDGIERLSCPGARLEAEAGAKAEEAGRGRQEEKGKGEAERGREREGGRKEDGER